jgi:hypothetical protein
MDSAMSTEVQGQRKFRVTFGKRKDQPAGTWTDRRDYTWPEICAKLTAHREGSKDGPCIVPATFRGPFRRADYAEEIPLVIYDFDGGYEGAEIEAAVTRLSYAACIYTTHSHLTISTTVNKKELDRSGLSAEQYLVQVKKYLPRVAVGAEAVTGEGDDVVIQHKPCPKYRLVLMMDRPWRAADFESQEVAIQIWRERYFAGALHLGLEVADPACADVTRLFFLPRHKVGAPFDTRIIDGAPFPIWDLPKIPEVEQPEPPKEPKPKAAHNGGDQDVIGAFNRTFSIPEIIEPRGYKKDGRKYVAPTSATKEAGISIKDGVLFSHHSSDPLFTGGARGDHGHDAFSTYCILEHDGDVRRAVKAAARLLGIPSKQPPGNGHCNDSEWPPGYTETPPKASSPKEEQPEKSCFSDIDLKTVSARRFLDREPEPLRWTLEESLPAGAYGMLVADGGTGKGFVAIQMGVSVATRLPFLDGLYEVPEHGKVVLVFGEDDELVIHHRLDGMIRSFGEDAAGDEFLERLRDNLHVISVCGKDARLIQSMGGHIIPTKAYDDLLRLLKSIENLKLVILDPLSRFYVGDENNAPEATYFCSLLERLAKETGATVLASQHTNKAAGTGKESLIQHAIRGSTGFTNAARWQLNLARVNPDEWRNLGIRQDEVNRYLVCKVVKKNLGPPENHFYLKRDANGTLRRAVVKEGVSERDKEVAAEVIGLLCGICERDGKRYTKRSFARDFAKHERWPDYGSHKLEKIIDHALDEGLLSVEEGKNPKGVTVDYLSARQL